MITLEQMALLHNSLSGGAAPTVSDVSLESSDDHQVHRFGADDLILYALSGECCLMQSVNRYLVMVMSLFKTVGATTQDEDNLRFLYENHEKFSAMPTYGVIPSLAAMSDSQMLDASLKSYKIEFNPAKLLHGEQYLELYRPIPTSGVFRSKARVVDVLDKGSGAVIILEVDTFDESGSKVSYNQSAIFLVGAGNFGGKKMSDRPEVKSVLEPPNRPPDVTVFEKTSADQAALYRLTGDKNPLHIDPAFASLGGFEKPILHGLCSLGYSCRQVLKQFGGNDPSKLKSVKVRFAGTISPGQTLQTDMWREGNRIHFQSICRETGKPVISGAYLDMNGEVVQLSPQAVLTSASDASNPSPAEVAFDTDDSDALLTDVVFEEIGRRIAMAPQLSKKVNGIFTFVIVKDRKEVKTWTMDMKQTPGVLYQGHSKTTPADCIIRITDQDMTALAVGELDPVRAFMTGKLKIKGNLMATQRLQSLFELNSAEVYSDTSKDKQVSAAGDDVSSSERMEFSSALAEKWGDMSRLVSAGSSYSGQSEYSDVRVPVASGNTWMCAAYDDRQQERRMFAADGGASGASGGSITPIIDLLFEKWLPTRLDDMKELVPVIKTVYQWNILQKGQVASVWTLDLKNGDGAIYKGSPKSGKADCILSIEDDFAVKIFEGKEDAMRVSVRITS